MTIKRHEVWNGNTADIAVLQRLTETEHYTVWSHKAYVLNSDVVEVFWLNSPQFPKAENSGNKNLNVANDVAITLQEEQLSRLVEAVKTGNFVVIDTETTGLTDDDIVVSIAFIDASGQTIGDYIVNTPNWQGSWGTTFHSISGDTIAGGDTWSDVYWHLINACAGKHIITYNAAFDMRLIRQTCVANKLNTALLDDMQPRVICAMEAFAVVYGELSPNKPGYKWQKLSKARDHYSIAPLPEHQALSDAQMTLKVARAIADDTTWQRR